MNESILEDLAETEKSKKFYWQRKKKIKFFAGIIAPPILFLIIFLIYQVFGIIFGSDVGWFLGLFMYWMVCGLSFSAWLIGIKRIKKLISPQKLKIKLVPLIIFPLVMAFIFKIISGTEYVKIDLWAIISLVITAFGNGIFEEILWRGAYMELYPNNNFLRIIYSTFWYAVFHFASGSLSSNSQILGLVIGSAFFGIYLSLLAKYTDTICWSILCHVLGGFIMVA